MNHTPLVAVPPYDRASESYLADLFAKYPKQPLACIQDAFLKCEGNPDILETALELTETTGLGVVRLTRGVKELYQHKVITKEILYAAFPEAVIDSDINHGLWVVFTRQG